MLISDWLVCVCVCVGVFRSVCFRSVALGSQAAQFSAGGLSVSAGVRHTGAQMLQISRSDLTALAFI